MAHQPTWGRPAAPRARPKGAAAPIACILFVTAMGAAFWIGTRVGVAVLVRAQPLGAAPRRVRR